MKHSLLAILVYVSLLGSCTKGNISDTPVTKDYPIQGLWIGTYTVNGQSNLGQQYFSFVIKPDGTMIADTKWGTNQHLSPGTWTLSGTTLSCTFTCVYGLPQHIGVVEMTTAEWQKEGKLSGTWKNPLPLTGSGNITLTRVN